MKNAHKHICISLTMIFLLSSLQILGQEELKLDLKTSIELGLQKHPNIEIYENNIRKAQQSKKEALSAYLPQVNAELGLDDNIKLQVQIIYEGNFGIGTLYRVVACGLMYDTYNV